MHGITLLVLCCCVFKPVIQGARILAVIPTHSYSHQLYFRPILIELSRRGHEIVYVTTLPINDPTLKNFSEIDVGPLYSAMSTMDFLAERWKRTWIDFTDNLWQGMSHMSAEKILAHPPIRKMYEFKTRQKFDLFITEFVWYHSLFGLAHIFNCPIVGLVSLGNMICMKDVLGFPPMPSHPSNWEMGNRTGYHVSFFQRLKNYITHLHYLYKYRYEYLPKQNQIAKTFFGDDFPDIEKVVKNTSLVIMNHHEAIQHPIVVTRKVVLISGIHSSKNISQKIPQKLKQFVDDAVKGFVFVSLGSNIKSRNLPIHLKQIFLEVFSELPYKVLWKYEDDTLPALSPNIYISNWFPQQLILGHPNIKVFITQGGLHSTEEAVSHGVPMVGLPILADQDSVLARMSELGLAKYLEITTLTKIEFDAVIREVIENQSFKDNAVKAQRLFNDKPHDSLQHAMWWIEYVIRNKGTPLHYYSLADDPWYSRYDEDVIAALSITLFIITCAALMSSIKLYKVCCKFVIKHNRVTNVKKTN